MKKTLILVAVAAGLADLSGCCNDFTTRRLTEVTYEPRSTNEVEILYERPDTDDFPHDDIAVIQTTTCGIPDVRRKAALLGGDAVIIKKLGGAPTRDGRRVDPKDVTGHTTVDGTVIVYHDEGDE